MPQSAPQRRAPVHGSTGWTAEEVRALYDEEHPTPRYEVVDGELLVTPAPTYAHQWAIFRLARLLDDYLRARRLPAEVIVAPADVELDPRSNVQPDVFVLPMVDGRRAESYAEAGYLLLAAEVISPSSARADRVTKRGRYQRAGVGEYWIVDVEARLIDRWRPDEDRPEILDESIAWQPDPAVPPLVVPLAEYFAEVVGGP